MTRDDRWWERFKDLLDEQNSWPSEYTFKFIVPSERLDDMKEVFGQVSVAVRDSSRGTYSSVTARMTMHSSDEVIAVYTAAGKVEGVIAL